MLKRHPFLVKISCYSVTFSVKFSVEVFHAWSRSVVEVASVIIKINSCGVTYFVKISVEVPHNSQDQLSQVGHSVSVGSVQHV